jgi:2-haloacid dehalogenase
MTLATPGEEFDAYVFDAYGTLFDVSGPARRLADRLGGKAGEVSRTWRDKQIQYLLLRSLQGAFEPFDKVTADALDYALEAHEVSDEGDLRAKLLEEYRQIEAYPWAKMTLDALKQAGRKTVILSNGSPDMLQSATQSAGLYGLVDEIISVDAVGINKPHSSVYQLVEHVTGVPPHRAVFVSSNGWDAFGAAHFGFHAAWLKRFPQPQERLPGMPRWSISCLKDVLETLPQYA